LRDDFFRDLLRRGYTPNYTEKQLDITIDWGRYGELFDYDADTGELVLSVIATALARELS
jgi:NitT/TauT family transport system ATP-binding protein